MTAPSVQRSQPIGAAIRKPVGSSYQVQPLRSRYRAPAGGGTDATGVAADGGVAQAKAAGRAVVAPPPDPEGGVRGSSRLVSASVTPPAASRAVTASAPPIASRRGAAAGRAAGGWCGRVAGGVRPVRRGGGRRRFSGPRRAAHRCHGGGPGAYRLGVPVVVGRGGAQQRLRLGCGQPPPGVALQQAGEHRAQRPGPAHRVRRFGGQRAQRRHRAGAGVRRLPLDRRVERGPQRPEVGSAGRRSRPGPAPGRRTAASRAPGPARSPRRPRRRRWPARSR